MIRAIVVDDEQGARDVLIKLLERSNRGIEVIDVASNVLEAVELIHKHSPEVVFLDVEMPNYAGYEIVNFFDEINFDIVFTTAYDQYAIKAFELSAIDYLLKPISRERLAKAVERLFARRQTNAQIEQYNILLESIQNRGFEKMVIPELNNKRIVNLTDVIAIEANGSYSLIHMNSGKPITVSKNLKHFEENLSDSKDFIRVHKSWIINLTHLRKYHPGPLCLELSNGIKTKLSRYKKEAFEKRIDGSIL